MLIIDINYLFKNLNKTKKYVFNFPIPNTNKYFSLEVVSVTKIEDKIYLTLKSSSKISSYKLIKIINNNEFNVLEGDDIIPNNNFTLTVENNMKEYFYLKIIPDYRDITWNETNYTWFQSVGTWNEQIIINLEGV